MPTGRLRIMQIRKEESKRLSKGHYLHRTKKTTSDDEHSESKFYYSDELEFHGKNKRASINYERVGAEEGEGNSASQRKRLKHSYKSKKLRLYLDVKTCEIHQRRKTMKTKHTS